MLKRNRQILEEGKTLSTCLLWSMIEEYYRTTGPDAWNETPYYPTSNAAIADTYAELIVAFLRDALSQIDPDHPVYLLEMATGSGAFSFLLLNALRDKLNRFKPLRQLRVCYVMTDFAEANVHSWEQESVFQTCVQDGILDFAVFHPESQDTITLRVSGTVLNQGTMVNPVVAIANYFFDSIRQDFFQTENGIVRETRLTLFRESDTATAPRLDQIQLQDRFVPIYTNYYPEPEFNALLKYYQQNLSIGSVLFPLGALRSLQNLRRLSGDRLLLIASDKGFNGVDYMRGHYSTPYTPHPGSFAYMVNFHALGIYFENLGGTVWHAQENPTLTTMVGVTMGTQDWDNLDYTSVNLLQRTNPIKNAYQFSPLLDQFEPRADSSEAESLKSAIALIQLSHYDPWIFSQCGEYLCVGMNDPDYGTRAVVRDLVERVERNLFRAVIGCWQAFSYVRRLYYILGDEERCLASNERIIALFGADRDAFYYPAALAESRGDQKTALHNYQAALQYDPDCAFAKAGVARTVAALS